MRKPSKSFGMIKPLSVIYYDWAVSTWQAPCWLHVIGTCFGSAGLSNVLVESYVVNIASVLSALEGRHYSHQVRVHKLVLEALR